MTVKNSCGYEKKKLTPEQFEDEKLRLKMILGDYPKSFVSSRLPVNYVYDIYKEFVSAGSIKFMNGSGFYHFVPTHLWNRVQGII